MALGMATGVVDNINNTNNYTAIGLVVSLKEAYDYWTQCDVMSDYQINSALMSRIETCMV